MGSCTPVNRASKNQEKDKILKIDYIKPLEMEKCTGHANKLSIEVIYKLKNH